MKQPFTFLVIADRKLRKGWRQAVIAFQRLFGDDPQFKLIIKTRYTDEVPNSPNPNIEIICQDYSDEQMVELYHRCHVMLFPSYGEGFGFPPREFAATGGVVMATNWSGTADDIEHWGVPLPYTLSSAWEEKSEWYGQLGQWAEVDADVLQDAMSHVVQHYAIYQQFAIRASGYVLTHYRWEQFAYRVKTIWTNVAQNISRSAVIA